MAIKTKDTPVHPIDTESSANSDSVDELEELEQLEFARRARLIQNRDKTSTETARKIASKWLSSETDKNQTKPLIEQHTYRIHYLRKNRPSNEYHQVNIQLERRLYDWISTHEWLAGKIRNQHDTRCDKVVTFYELQSPEVSDSSATSKLDECVVDIMNAKRIEELEAELSRLRNDENGKAS